MNAQTGYLAIILHAHLPYVRHPEHVFSLEEHWLFEAMTESYIPLLHTMDRLVKDRVDFRLTFSITPTLAAMLRDPFLQSRYLRRLDSLIELTGREIRRTRKEPALQGLASMYRSRFKSVRDLFVGRYRKDLLKGFQRLQKLGKIEIMACAATHGYLPLLALNPSAVRAQVSVGISSYKRIFGTRPGGFWLPECGYYPGLEDTLKEFGIEYFVLETHGVNYARPRPKDSVFAPILCPSGVAAFGRDPESSRQVWSSIEGYPGDFDYREFYRDVAYDLEEDYIGPYIHPDGIRLDTGIKYFRITGRGERKGFYSPAAAEKKAGQHAEDFLLNRQKQVEYLAPILKRTPLVVAPYDAELFGHWWYEGPVWLDRLIRKIGQKQSGIRLITPSEYLDEYPVDQISTPSMSSWGREGYSKVWLNESTEWVYPRLHEAAFHMETLARRSPSNILERRALEQAGRELLLAQASDWAFMISSGTTSQYAGWRLEAHLRRFERLRHQIENQCIDEDGIAVLECKDNIFPDLDYRAFLPVPVSGSAVTSTLP